MAAVTTKVSCAVSMIVVEWRGASAHSLRLPPRPGHRRALLADGRLLLRSERLRPCLSPSTREPLGVVGHRAELPVSPFLAGHRGSIQHHSPQPQVAYLRLGRSTDLPSRALLLLPTCRLIDYPGSR